MAAPKVQSLNQIIAELQPGYAGQQKLYKQQISQVGKDLSTQKQGLAAEKVQGFNTINNQATGRGLSFSGIPLDEQATYLSTKYLPAVADLESGANQQRLTLQQALAALNTDIRNRALDTRQTQQSALETYLENERQRRFDAQQAALDRAAEAARAASSAAADAPPTIGQYIADLLAENYSGENVRNSWTEKYAAGNVANAYGISRQEALKRLYAARKAYER